VISKFDGRCVVCGKPTHAGVDQYDMDTREAYHLDCKSNQPPNRETFALAERLGYLPHAEACRTNWMPSTKKGLLE
jgi:hypothetical protein